MEATPWIGTAVALLVLTAVAVIGLVLFRVARPWGAAVALVRASVQLAALSLVLAGVIEDPRLVAVALVVMFAGAVGTASHRAGTGWSAVPAITAVLAAGVLVSMSTVFLTGAVDAAPRYMLAVGGIVIGNTMTVVTVTQRVFRSVVGDRWSEVEGWLALGARPRVATRDIAREAVRTALLPSVDQTSTTGIVVLPGAFVGAIFAGAAPLEAGRFQLLVLACILASGVIASTLITRLTPLAAVAPALPDARSDRRS